MHACMCVCVCVCIYNIAACRRKGDRRVCVCACACVRDCVRACVCVCDLCTDQRRSVQLYSLKYLVHKIAISIHMRCISGNAPSRKTMLLRQRRSWHHKDYLCYVRILVVYCRWSSCTMLHETISLHNNILFVYGNDDIGGIGIIHAQHKQVS